MKLLLYCTKSKPTLYNVLGKFITTKYMGKDFMQDGITHPELNGKIVAECDFEVEHLYNAYSPYRENDIHYFDTDTLNEAELIKRSRLSNLELENYFKNKNGYAIYIKNLHIFEKPRELSEFYSIHNVNDSIDKAPQNMCKVFELFNDGTTKDYILISIRPEWICKILNGEKTIEVRKKILKEMINNALI